METTLTFGQQITVLHKLVRTCEFVNYQHHKKWEVVTTTPKLVMVIGKRTLYNGITHFDGEDGTWFEFKEPVNAYLVVENMKNKPFYIEAL